MRKSLCAVTAFVLAAGALVTSATSSSARQQAPPTSSVTVSGDGTHVAVSSMAVHTGYVTFRVRATTAVDSDIVLFRPKADATVADVVRGVRPV